MDAAPITDEERSALTIWGEDIAAQVRDRGLAVKIGRHIVVTQDDLSFVQPRDVAKLRGLLNEAHRRGECD